MSEAAIQFVLQVPGVSVVIPGVSTRLHLRENLKAFDAPPLTPEESTRMGELAAVTDKATFLGDHHL